MTSYSGPGNTCMWYVAYFCLRALPGVSALKENVTSYFTIAWLKRLADQFKTSLGWELLLGPCDGHPDQNT